MTKSTKMLLAAVVVLNALLVAWGLLEPSQRDLRMPIWFVEMLMIGAVADRFLCKRT